MKFSQKKLLISVLCIVFLGTIIWFVWHNNKRDEPGVSLVPKQTITIAGTRAISPCQALPEQSVEKIYGIAGPTSYIEESYYSRTVNDDEVKKLASAFPATVSCSYTLNDEANSVVRVEFEQYATEALALREWNEIGSYNKARALELLGEFDAGIPGA
jgi:hypothetical protein